MKKYIELEETRNATHIKVEVFYNLGGHNVFTGAEESRGYYLSVSPVRRENKYGHTIESYVAFSGKKRLVKAVSRRSEKAYQAAVKTAVQIESDLIAYVLADQGLKLREV